MTDKKYGPPTDAQKLLDDKLDYYQSLDRGTREPRTGEEKHFVLVCRGKAMAVTHDEHAYKQFREETTFDPKAYLAANRTIKKPKPIKSQGQITKSKNKKINKICDQSNLSSGSRYFRTEISDAEKKKLNREEYMAALERKRERDQHTGGIPEYEEGDPRSEFGTREEYKKMRGREFSDIRRRKNE